MDSSSRSSGFSNASLSDAGGGLQSLFRTRGLFGSLVLPSSRHFPLLLRSQYVFCLIYIAAYNDMVDLCVVVVPGINSHKSYGTA